MVFDFTGQRVVVTGATRGIGKQVADDFYALGAELILTGTDPREVARLNREARASRRKYYCVDFTRKAGVQSFLKVLERQERIDVCVNNAGINRINLLADTLEKDWDDMVAVNLKGPYLVTRAVGKLMQKNRYGRIVNIASIFGVVSKPGRAIYSTTKFGLRGLTVAVSNELAGHGVLVNAVSPGFVLTDLTRKNLSPKERKALTAQIPVGRMAEPADISRVVVFLASSLNTYLTGKNIVVDGGFIDG